jgi:DNA replication and repair protein RecF
MISRLCLQDFRNYSGLDIHFSEGPVVFYGANGMGKTNILEAISLFTAGNGLRNGKIQDFFRSQNAETMAPPQPKQLEQCGVGIKIEPDFFEEDSRKKADVSLTTYMEVSANNALRRVCKIQGKTVKNAACFYDYLNIVSITPTVDLLFIEPAKTRRDFIDSLISSYNSAHSLHLHNYEKAARQRLAILKKMRVSDEEWLSSLEETMAQSGTAIAEARSNFVHLLDEGQLMCAASSTKFTSKIVGEAEGLPPEALMQKLKLTREKDSICGFTSFGCHRSDWVATHVSNNRKVRDCSTGEQKITLISVILSFIHRRMHPASGSTEWRGVEAQAQGGPVQADPRLAPGKIADSVGTRPDDPANFRWLGEHKNDKLLVLLLDDVVARLDHKHRNVLFDQLLEIERNVKGSNDGGSLQVFFSGIERESFADLNNAQFFEVADLGRSVTREVAK